MGVSPEGALLARGVDWDKVIKCLSGGDATIDGMRWQTRGRLCSIPLRDGDGAVHPAGRVEEHAMVVEGRWRVEGVSHVEEERVGCVDCERRRSGGRLGQVTTGR
jgi:hypothetical protein